MTEFISLLGKISGRVGDVVFVQRGNTTYVKKRPAKRSTPYSEKEAAHLRKFGFACKLAAKISETGELKYFWKPERWNNRSSCNRIFKENFSRINQDSLEGYITLVPSFGFNISEYKGKITETGFEIKCKLLQKGGDDYGATAKYVIGGGVIVLKNPRNKKQPEYSIISFRSEKMLFNPGKQISLEIEIKGSDANLFKGYADKKVYISVITLDKNETPIKYSNTMQL